MDSDKNQQVKMEDIERVNHDVKLIRGLIRSLLLSTRDFKTPVPFNEMGFLDKVMMRQLLLF